MTDDYSDKAYRLLDIIESIVSNDNGYPDLKLPFWVDENGIVIFDQQILVELEKPENQDLITWAFENVVELFS
jgi:hypothetical protein